MTLVPASSHGAFNGGTIANPFVVKDALAHTLFEVDSTGDTDANLVPGDGGTITLADGSTTFQLDDLGKTVSVTLAAGWVFNVRDHAAVDLLTATEAARTVAFPAGIQSGQQTSGALSTLTISSGTGRQISTTSDRETVTPFTGDGTNNVASCAIALSPDNSTYSTLNTRSYAAAVNLTGAIDVEIAVRVPAGWYIKLTASHGTIGTTTYY